MKRLLLCVGMAIACMGAVAPKPFKTHFQNKSADFSYSWPAEVSAIPALVKRFTADMRKQREATIEGGKELVEERAKMGFESVGYSHTTEISSAGETARLLSLRIDVSEYTGGAHGNYGAQALIWDRKLGRERSVAQLFRPGAAYVVPLRAAFCRGLDLERKKKRGGNGKLDGTIPEFDACPKLDDLAIYPEDENGDLRFEQFALVAAPYLAGPYVEGEYDVVVPMTAKLIALLKPEYRRSFEVQRQ